MNNPTPRDKESDVNQSIYRISKTFNLPKPEQFPDKPFLTVLTTRKSSREFGFIGLEQLSEVLWLSAKVKSSKPQGNGYILTNRPSPSAGARHPIDLIVSSPMLDDGKSLFYYNPFNHSLNKLEFGEGISGDKLKKHLLESFPTGESATVIWFVAHKDRTEAKYEYADSLIWRDIGALASYIQLVCNYSQINSCIGGTLGYPFFSELFPYENVLSGGCILLGSKLNT